MRRISIIVFFLLFSLFGFSQKITKLSEDSIYSISNIKVRAFYFSSCTFNEAIRKIDLAGYIPVPLESTNGLLVNIFDLGSLDKFIFASIDETSVVYSNKLPVVPYISFSYGSYGKFSISFVASQQMIPCWVLAVSK
ncbi:MAG: hypothetical protein WCX46_02850 [Candidatus Paceibacterota bacterium]